MFGNHVTSVQQLPSTLEKKKISVAATTDNNNTSCGLMINIRVISDGNSNQTAPCVKGPHAPCAIFFSGMMTSDF